MSISNTEKRVRDIRRKTRRKFSSEEKIRIVLEGLRGECSIAELCRICIGMYDMCDTGRFREIATSGVIDSIGLRCRCCVYARGHRIPSIRCMVSGTFGWARNLEKDARGITCPFLVGHCMGFYCRSILVVPDLSLISRNGVLGWIAHCYAT